jgi:hypothetical protein
MNIRSIWSSGIGNSRSRETKRLTGAALRAVTFAMLAKRRKT